MVKTIVIIKQERPSNRNSHYHENVLNDKAEPKHTILVDEKTNKSYVKFQRSLTDPFRETSSKINGSFFNISRKNTSIG
jgi:hypothetical protein